MIMTTILHGCIDDNGYDDITIRIAMTRMNYLILKMIRLMIVIG